MNRFSQGFTLVELAISIAIVAILLGGALISVSQYIKAERVNQTRQKMDVVMNVLSGYVQAHYRLPCPADPGVAAANQGKETACLTAGTAAAANTLYIASEGILPWKELGIPQDAVTDAWGHYLTYKPAPNLTADMTDPKMQDSAKLADGTPNPNYIHDNPIDVHNACRTAMWYDAGGHHVNRAKALFCCDAQPTAAYLGAAMPGAWRQNGVVDTDTAKATPGSAAGSMPTGTPVLATSNWSDPVPAPTGGPVYGTFANPNNGIDAYNGNSSSTAPLLRATGLAVTLISHGGDGNFAFLPEQLKSQRLGGTVTTATGAPSGPATDIENKNAGWPQIFAGVIGHPKKNTGTFDLLNSGPGRSDAIVSYLRSDQIFAKAGSGSCEYPPNPTGQTYQCSGVSYVNPGSNPTPGGNFGLQLTLAPNQKYKLTTSLQRLNANQKTGFRNGLGFYVIDSDYTIQNVTAVESNNLTQALGAKLQSNPIEVAGGSAAQGVGIFITPNSGSDSNWYNSPTIIGSGTAAHAVQDTNTINGDANGLDGTYEKKMGLSPVKSDNNTLMFINPNTGQPAKITDTVPPRLYSVSATADPTVITRGGILNGQDIPGYTTIKTYADGFDMSSTSPVSNGIAYHLSSNLNPEQASHTLNNQQICANNGDLVGVNHDMTCTGATSIASVGAGKDAGGIPQYTIGFEDLPYTYSSNDSDAYLAGFNQAQGCIEMSDGTCQRNPDTYIAQPAHAGVQKLIDGYGGYLAKVGDHTDDDVTSAVTVTTCPDN